MAEKRVILLLIPLMILSSACVIFGRTFESIPPIHTPGGVSYPSTKTPANSPTVSTPTRIPPTRTATPTETSTFTPIPSSTSTATLTLTPELPDARFPETPVPVPQSIEYPDGQMRILLLGVDDRNRSAFRSDAIMLLTLNTQQNTASLVSIPPMLYVNIPEVGMERINSAISFGGAGKVNDTLQYNLGIRADRYLSIDALNFRKILNSIGPILVQVTTQLIDRCDLPQAVEGWCVIEPGINQMDQDTAFWYVRDRAGGETERMRRSQEVLLGAFNRLIDTQALIRINELYSAFYESVETDLTVDDLVYLSPTAYTIFTNGQIKRYSFSTNEAVPVTLPGGENVMLLNQKAAWNLIQQAVFRP